MAGRDGKEKKYELLEVREDGTEVRLYESGEKRNQNGQLVEAAPWNNIITAETARQYHSMRKQKVLDAIEKKLVDVTRTSAPAEAIAHIVGKRAEIAMRDETRTGNEAAKIVLSAVDAYQERQQQTVQTTRHEYALDEETRSLLESMIQERRREAADYTEGEVKE